MAVKVLLFLLLLLVPFVLLFLVLFGLRSFQLTNTPALLNLLDGPWGSDPAFFIIGFFGVGKLRLVLLVLIFLLVALPFLVPVVMLVEALFLFTSMRLGGRCHDRIYHVDRSDEFDVTQFWLLS